MDLETVCISAVSKTILITPSKSSKDSSPYKRLTNRRAITTQSPTSSEVRHHHHKYILMMRYDMKCFFIPTETILLCQPPPAVSISRSTEQEEAVEGSLSHLAPIITHTAATPQGSPNATLEPISSRDNLSRLSPKSALARAKGRSSDTSLHHPHYQGSANELVSLKKNG